MSESNFGLKLEIRILFSVQFQGKAETLALASFRPTGFGTNCEHLCELAQALNLERCPEEIVRACPNEALNAVRAFNRSRPDESPFRWIYAPRAINETMLEIGLYDSNVFCKPEPICQNEKAETKAVGSSKIFMFRLRDE